jgi:Na+/H+-dicarboxylate symporter
LIGFCKLIFFFNFIDLLLNIKIFEFINQSDRLRTTTNVWGDSIGAAIVQHLSSKEIANIDAQEERHQHELEKLEIGE